MKKLQVTLLAGSLFMAGGCQEEESAVKAVEEEISNDLAAKETSSEEKETKTEVEDIILTENREYQALYDETVSKANEIKSQEDLSDNEMYSELYTLWNETLETVTEELRSTMPYVDYINNIMIHSENWGKVTEAEAQEILTKVQEETESYSLGDVAYAQYKIEKIKERIILLMNYSPNTDEVEVHQLYTNAKNAVSYLKVQDEPEMYSYIHTVWKESLEKALVLFDNNMAREDYLRDINIEQAEWEANLEEETRKIADKVYEETPDYVFGDTAYAMHQISEMEKRFKILQEKFESLQLN